MSDIPSYAVNWILQQGPVVVVLVLVALDLRRKLASITAYNQDLLETLLELQLGIVSNDK